jgi:hypothetical protein
MISAGPNFLHQSRGEHHAVLRRRMPEYQSKATQRQRKHCKKSKPEGAFYFRQIELLLAGTRVLFTAGAATPTPFPGT